MTIPGYEGTVGPFPSQYGQPHVYARDVHSGAGNCVCGRDDTHQLHVPVPASPRGSHFREKLLDFVRAHGGDTTQPPQTTTIIADQGDPS